MEYIIASLVIAWVVGIIYRGYQESTSAPLPLRDNGHGAMEPVCPHCSTKLVTVTRKGGIGLTGVLGWLSLLAGAAVFLLFNWLAGSVVVIVGILLVMLGKSTETMLTCPACGKDAKRLA